MGVVNEAVEDGVGAGRIADDLAPLLDRNLAGDDRRSALMAVLQDFEEIALFGLCERRQAPVVEDQELDARETLEQAAIAAVAASERQRLEQARNPMVNHASAIPAGLLAESAGDPALADAGGPGDQKSFGAVDPVAGDEPLEQGAVDAARRSQVDVLDDGEFVATFVPLTGRDEILYEVMVDEADLRPAV